MGPSRRGEDDGGSSPEPAARGRTLGPEEVVEALYRGLLDRFPDPPGLAHNVGVLEAGLDLSRLVEGIRRSPEASVGFLRSTDLADVGPNLWRGTPLRRREPPLYFCHIMKTGGTALVDAMVAEAGERFCLTQIFLDHLVAMPALVLNRASLVSGHLGLQALQYLPADTVTVTVLRDPVERTLSHYAHVLADPALTEETADLSLEEFVHSPRWRPLSSNFQARGLVHRLDLAGAWVDYSPLDRLAELGDAAPLSARLPLHTLFDLGPLERSVEELGAEALRALDRVDHVGVSDHLDRVWRQVAARWGIDHPAPPRVSNVSASRLAADDVPPSLRQAIIDANQVDATLYERAASIAGVDPRRRRAPAPRADGCDPDRSQPPPVGQWWARRRLLSGRPGSRAGEAAAAFGLVVSVLVAVADAVNGNGAVLIAALAAGPCAAVATGRWKVTAAVGVLSVAMALALGASDGIWGTGTHAVLVGLVLVVAVLATVLCRAVGRRRRPDRGLALRAD
ncbi:MAG TPA: hypothetical protein VFH45_02825 [Acidimicrobiales bacterium]|nr:hypothetical protein [Acidimicrobiales bacterium]